MKLVIGLGNPGPEYEHTRHNAGFRVVDKLAAKLGWKWNERRNRAIIASGTIGPEKVLLVKPITYMNNSGEAVGELVRWHKVQPEDVIVVYDELDLPVGRVRLKSSGSAAGHNGMSNVLRHLHTDRAPRLRVGIGRPTNSRVETINYVLGIPPTEERIQLDAGEERAADAIPMIIRQGVATTMNLINADPEAQQRAEEKRRQERERREQERLRREQERLRREQERTRESSLPTGADVPGEQKRSTIRMADTLTLRVLNDRLLASLHRALVHLTDEQLRYRVPTLDKRTIAAIAMHAYESLYGFVSVVAGKAWPASESVPSTTTELLARVDALHETVDRILLKLPVSTLTHNITMPWGQELVGLDALADSVAHGLVHAGVIEGIRAHGGFPIPPEE